MVGPDGPNLPGGGRSAVACIQHQQHLQSTF